MYKKLLVCKPSPHTSNSPPSAVSAALRNMAAGAFSLPPFQVPCGPKILWNLATRTFKLKLRWYAKKILSLNNFSQPYSESGLAGYAELSTQLGLVGSN